MEENAIELRRQLDVASNERAELLNKNRDYEKQIADLCKQNRDLILENCDLNQRVETLQQKNKSLKFQFENAVESKCETLASHHEVESKKVVLPVEERNLEEDTTALNARIQSLQNEIANSRNEFSAQVLDLESCIKNKTLECSEYKNRNEEEKNSGRLMQEKDKAGRDKIQSSIYFYKSQGQIQLKNIANFKDLKKRAKQDEHNETIKEKEHDKEAALEIKNPLHGNDLIKEPIAQLNAERESVFRRLDDCLREVAALRRALKEKVNNLVKSIKLDKENTILEFKEEKQKVRKLRADLKSAYENIDSKVKQIEDISKEFQETLSSNREDNTATVTHQQAKISELEAHIFRLEELLHNRNFELINEMKARLLDIEALSNMKNECDRLSNQVREKTRMLYQRNWESTKEYEEHLERKNNIKSLEDSYKQLQEDRDCMAKRLTELNDRIKKSSEESSSSLKTNQRDLRVEIDKLTEQNSSLNIEAKMWRQNVDFFLTESQNMHRGMDQIENIVAHLKSKGIELSKTIEGYNNQYLDLHNDFAAQAAGETEDARSAASRCSDSDEMETDDSSVIPGSLAMLGEMRTMHKESERTMLLKRQMSFEQTAKPLTSSVIMAENNGHLESSSRTAGVGDKVQQSSTVTVCQENEIPSVAIAAIPRIDSTPSAPIVKSSQEAKRVQQQLEVNDFSRSRINNGQEDVMLMSTCVEDSSQMPYSFPLKPQPDDGNNKKRRITSYTATSHKGSKHPFKPISMAGILAGQKRLYNDVVNSFNRTKHTDSEKKSNFQAKRFRAPMHGKDDVIIIDSETDEEDSGVTEANNMPEAIVGTNAEANDESISLSDDEENQEIEVVDAESTDDDDDDEFYKEGGSSQCSADDSDSMADDSDRSQQSPQNHLHQSQTSSSDSTCSSSFIIAKNTPQTSPYNAAYDDQMYQTLEKGDNNCKVNANDKNSAGGNTSGVGGTDISGEGHKTKATTPETEGSQS